MKWQLTVYYIIASCTSSYITQQNKTESAGKLLNVITKYSEKLGPTIEMTSLVSRTGTTNWDNVTLNTTEKDHDPTHRGKRPLQHARVARNLNVNPLPLPESDHELMFNVTWNKPLGPPVIDYSLEIRSMTNTVDCKSSLCYEYNIPGNAEWWVMPAVSQTVAGTCAVRPGCSYQVRLISHPWDGHTAANLRVQLDECVSNVCSCAHASHLPTPEVSAITEVVNNQRFANISWTVPAPETPTRLPKALNKQYYLVSLGKQMVSDAHPSPWYAHTASRKVDTDGPIASGDDNVRWVLLPIDEKSDERSGNRTNNNSEKGDGRQYKLIVVDVKLLARVSLIDDRGCVGPAGNSTAYEPEANVTELPYQTIAIWVAFGGVGVLLMLVLLAISTRAVKRLLHAVRPASAPAALKPIRRRPIWFPLQLSTQPLDGEYIKKDRQYYNKQNKPCGVVGHPIGTKFAER